MTRRFRTTLFIALAAAVGLHLRPCLGCLFTEENSQEGAEAAVVAGAERPAISAMVSLAAAPVRVR